MRQLGEQWIEEIDGKRHMVVEMKSDKEHGGCQRCIFNGGHGTCVYPEDDCPVQNGHHIKDLGPVNEDGLLWCPFCKEFPKGVSKGTEYKNDCEISIFYIEHSCKVIQTTEFAYSEQECIDAWNRRVM